MARQLAVNGLAVAECATEKMNFDRIGSEMAAGWVVHLAWHGKSLVGFLALKSASGCLDQLFIAPAVQGTGVGRRLLELAKQLLPDGLWLRTAVDNRRACRFYERSGLRACETVVHPTFGHPTVIYRWP